MAKTHLASEEIETEESASKGDEYQVEFDIKGSLQRLKPPLSPNFCIYMVPKKLRTMNEAAYTPQVVSIGPFHYGGKAYKKMEAHKLRYLEKFLDRRGNNASLNELVKTIKMSESDIRSCYAETFDHLSRDEFVKIILVDACFIFELFLRNIFEDHDPYDPFPHKPWLEADVEQDLILLENQLPFSVLESLYVLAFPSEEPFLELTCNYFSGYNQQEKPIPKDIKHFTDLMRYFTLPSSDKPGPQSRDESNQQNVKHFTDFLKPVIPQCCRRGQPKLEQNSRDDHLFSATELHDAGVKFKVSTSQCLLDIEFSKDGVLKIPCLTLDDDTETFLRNLMALEQCHYRDELHTCDYVSLMDYLINTSKDVDLLVEKKIIVNMLGDREPVATMFNNLCTHIDVSPEGLYTKQCNDMNAYYESRCHKWKAILRREYFSTPWRFASTTAAIMLLLLTWTQTICSIFSLQLQSSVHFIIIASLLLFFITYFLVFYYYYQKNKKK